MLQAVDGPATGAVVVTADGASVRVRVTATQGVATAKASRPAIGPPVHALAGRAGARTETARRALERAMWRPRRASGGPPDDYSAQPRPRQETDDTPAGDRAVLTALYDAAGGDNWWRDTHWLSDRPLGEWYGVTTDSDGRVTALELADNRLTGAVPEALGSLTRLRTARPQSERADRRYSGRVGRAGRPEAVESRLQRADRSDPAGTGQPVQPRVAQSSLERVPDADPARVGQSEQA